tara:strand:- start:429 stop:1061 length:633 start_codon:yes stop_codon:yes gene_type:complete
MEENTHEIIKLFSQPLLKTYLPNKFSNIVNWLDNQEIEFSENPDWGSVSSNTQLLNSPECSELSNYILSLAFQFADEVLSLDHPSYKFSTSWISIKTSNDSHFPHIHSNSIISGVFYYGHYGNDTPGINFIHPPQPTGNFELAPRFKNNKNPRYQPYTFPAYPGVLYMFPSYIPHSVSKNETSSPRKSVSFNIVPTDGLGDNRILNNLSF